MTIEPAARPRYRIVLIEDSADDAELIGFALRSAPFDFTLARAETEAEFTARLDEGGADVILCDYHLPRFDMARALSIVRRERGLDVPFIVVSRLIGEDAAVEAMRDGADDYLLKGRLGRLQAAIQAALERIAARRAKLAAEAALRRSDLLNRSLLDSLAMRIVVVDATGGILAANRAWGENAARPLGAPPALGENLIERLRGAPEGERRLADELREGIEAVIGRREPSFALEYQVPGENARWHALRALPLADSEHGAVVSIEDVTARMLTHFALHEANRRLQELSRRVLAVQEEERRAIALELHDDFGQSLAALKIALYRMRDRLAGEDAAQAGACIGVADEMLDRMRRLAYSLRPPQLEQLGLEAALRELVRQQSGMSGAAIEAHVADMRERPHAAVEAACFRIAQEALNNATRHANASRIAVELEPKGRLLQLVVRDNGEGFDMEGNGGRAGGSSLGLVGMAERAELAGGRLKIRSRRSLGTRVSALFPLDGPGAAEPLTEAERE